MSGLSFAMIVATLLWVPLPALADQITVAAAADLTFAFKDVAAKFQQQSGDIVKLSFGSSGNFFSQIQNGAPFDLFFSADIGYAKKLEAAGLIEPGSLYEYAIGKIVLWVPNASKLDVSKGLAILSDPSINKIAIANPEHAPYGRAAMAAMKHAGIYDQLKDKIVLGENISQTAQFVQSGSADIGIVALSLAISPTMKDTGKYFEIPGADYPAIEQAAVIVKSSKKKDLARKFLSFLRTPEIVALMEHYGFAVPKQAIGASAPALQ
ncbi:MAG TPA: molybdate ABC transporter substrate-binding protein [Candidatus Binataceae bacterium]|nr:molybdate ABC transporter substrate-binding protein [Candidatus Binataceae bacterium]